MNFKRFRMPVIYNPAINEGINIYVLKAHSYTYNRSGIIGYLAYDYYIGGMHTVKAVSINSDLTFGDKSIPDAHLKRVAELLNDCSHVDGESSFIQFMTDAMNLIEYLYDTCEEEAVINQETRYVFDFIEESIGEKIPDKEELIGETIAGILLSEPSVDYNDEPV